MSNKTTGEKTSYKNFLAATGEFHVKWGELHKAFCDPEVQVLNPSQRERILRPFANSVNGLDLYWISQGPMRYYEDLIEDEEEGDDRGKNTTGGMPTATEIAKKVLEEVNKSREKNQQGHPSGWTLVCDFNDMNGDCMDFFINNLEKFGDRVRRRFEPIKEGVDTLIKEPHNILIENVSQLAIIGSLAFNTSTDEYNVKVKFDGKWYPVTAQFREQKSWFGHFCEITANASILGFNQRIGGVISAHRFKDGPVSFGRLLEEVSVKTECTKSDIKKYEEQISDAQETRMRYGSQILVKGNALMPTNTFWGGTQLVPIQFGTGDSPCRVIIDAELEADDDETEPEGSIQELPYVRVFAPDRKKFIFVHIDDVEEYHYDVDAIDKLVLPSELERDLKTVLTCDTHEMFGDVISGKSGGLIIFANGPTGVGKTLTAEVFAEYTQRPLYVMEMGELGTDVKTVEESLQRIFMRASRWDAVLLFDEADVLLAKRTENLERSAIVSVFLRLLDYYKGVLFMTSNRGEIIDKAVKSRITMWVDYPELSDETRQKIWRTLCKAAQINYQGDWYKLGRLGDFNGREIRSLVRLLKLLYPRAIIEFEEVKNVAKFRPQLDQDKNMELYE